MQSARPPLKLSAPLDPEVVGVVTGFSEQSGLAMGLNKKEAMKLALASEEVFIYLSGHARHDHYLELEAVGGGYYAQIKINLPPGKMDLKVFNLTASTGLNSSQSLDQLGLLIAARSMDKFTLTAQADGDILLSFTKEKIYPHPTGKAPKSAKSADGLKVDAPNMQQAKLASRLIVDKYAPHQYPPGFAIPGKLVDMLASGEYEAAVAFDREDRLGGCIIWRWRRDSTVQSFGPYIFCEGDADTLANDLVEACLRKLARTKAQSLICSHAAEHLPEGSFELLGHLTIYGTDAPPHERPHYYREIREDTGTQIWTHPRLEKFLEQEYQRLALPRMIGTNLPAGESRPDHLVLGSRINRDIAYVSLHPLWDGKDSGVCLTNHIEALTKSGLINIMLFLDLGLNWSAYLVPDLLDHGFAPRMVLPYGGESDVVVFQYESKNE